jgi:hypothetical protein
VNPPAVHILMILFTQFGLFEMLANYIGIIPNSLRIMSYNSIFKSSFI